MNISYNLKLIFSLIFFFFFLADPATDHKLKWDMFKLSELECFDSMMFRMFKQEMEALISRHESYRYGFPFLNLFSLSDFFCFYNTLQKGIEC